MSKVIKKLRPRNPVARDLRTPKYRQKIERNRKKLARDGYSRCKSLDLLGF